MIFNLDDSRYNPSEGSACNVAGDPFPEIVGQSLPILQLKAALQELARLDAAVLVRGESGAGKELAAQALHRGSSRARRPFVAVNCAAIPRELLESELFGCEPGAFTGARRRDGHVARADRGTLFLDELGELSLTAQAVLLRVLESGEFTPVGGERSRRADFRLVCATHRDLAKMVREGQFRLDLYHRICALTVDVPPLRARPGDLPLLARSLLGVGAPSLTHAAWGKLAAYSWPGNVRELRNVLIRARARAATRHFDGRLDVGDVVLDDLGCLESERPRPVERAPGQAVRGAVSSLIRGEVERQAGNVRAAARALGVSHTTVYRHLRDVPAGLAAQGLR